ELIHPLSIRNLLEDSLLQAILIEKIGKKLFLEEIQDMVTELDRKRDYEDLTRSFIDVYHFDVQNKDLTEKNQVAAPKSKMKEKISESIEAIDSFDYSFFKQGLNKHFIRQDSITKEIKELIYTYHTIYGIDELAMQSIVLESADVESGKINKNKLTNTVQRMYLNQQKTDMKIRQSKLTDSDQSGNKQEIKKSKLTKKGFSPSEISVIRHAKKAAPAHYLRSIKDQRKGFVTSNEIWVLKELVEQSPLSKEVINILLHYILVIQKAVILEKNYATKIANDWAQNDIKTAEDAVAKLRGVFSESRNQLSKNKKSSRKKSYSKNYRRKPKKEKLPDWAREDQKNQQPKKDSSPSKGDEALRKRLERIRKQRKSKEDS
ncbi:MAG: DnaD domain protein, partial [Atopostipes suicloacalis]|nr:DnaD domain protein [Atopostipes suicloacalis]